MGAGDFAGDDCQRPIALSVPFDAVGMDKHAMGHAAPFAHKPRAGFNEISAELTFAHRRTAIQC